MKGGECSFCTTSRNLTPDTNPKTNLILNYNRKANPRNNRNLHKLSESGVLKKRSNNGNAISRCGAETTLTQSPAELLPTRCSVYKLYCWYDVQIGEAATTASAGVPPLPTGEQTGVCILRL